MSAPGHGRAQPLRVRHQPPGVTNPVVLSALWCHQPCSATSPLVSPAPWCHQPCGVPSPMVSPAPWCPMALLSGEASDLVPCLPHRPGHEHPTAAPALRQPSPEHWGWIQCQVPAEVVLGTGLPASRSSLCREMCVFMCVCVCICMPKTPNWFIYIFMHLNIASCANDGCSTSTTSVLSQTCYFPTGFSICSVRVLKCCFSHTVSGRKLQCSLYILSIT